MRHAFSRRDRHLLTALYCHDDSLTKQSEKDSTDINRILSRYHDSGIPLPAQQASSNDFNDFSGITADYRSMLDVVRQSQASFSALSPKLRKRFKTPEQLLEFCSDDANYAEADSLGLLEKMKQKNINFESDSPSEAAPKSKDGETA